MKSKKALIRTVWLAGLICVFAASLPARAALTTGTATGIFTDPVGPPTMETYGSEGSDDFVWGVAVSGSTESNLKFIIDPAVFTVTTAGDPFKIGFLQYKNGSIADTTQAEEVTLKLSIAFSSADDPNYDFNFKLILENTVNDDPFTPDYVELNNGTPLSPHSIASTMISIGGIPYLLKLSFGTVYDVDGNVADPLSEGFTSPNGRLFWMYEDAEAGKAELFGTLIAPAPDTGASLILLGISFVILPFARRKFSRRN